VSSSTTVPSSTASIAPAVTADSVQTKSPLGLKHFLAIGIVLLLVVLALWFYFSGRVTTDDAQVDCHITAASSLVSGYVVELAINDNVMVKQGDLLVRAAAGDKIERRSIIEALAAPSWLDPKTGVPRT